MITHPGQFAVAAPRTALARLARRLPAGVREVLTTLQRAGGEAVVVGGAVRDAFLDRPTQDWDVATDLVPEHVASLFRRVVRAGEKHGTIMVLTRTGPVEVTTYRREGAYVDGRRPAFVEFHGDLAADLARRDFTINALAVELQAARLVDPFGGVRDLHRRRVRCVGEPSARFAEDGLRPLRAVRFAAVLGFRIERSTRAALRGALDTFARVSWERKRDEMTRLLSRGRRFSRVVSELDAAGMLAVLAPELRGAPRTRLGALDRLPDDAPWLRLTAWAWLARLAPTEAGALLRRWRVATHDARTVERYLSALELLSRRVPSRGETLRRWLSVVGSEETALAAARLAHVLWGDAYHDFPIRVRRLVKAAPTVRLAQLAIDGDDLVAAGFSGPVVGRVLHQLLDWVIEHPKANRRETLLRIAHNLSTDDV